MEKGTGTVLFTLNSVFKFMNEPQYQAQAEPSSCRTMGYSSIVDYIDVM